MQYNTHVANIFQNMFDLEPCYSMQTYFYEEWRPSGSISAVYEVSHVRPAICSRRGDESLFMNNFNDLLSAR